MSLDERGTVAALDAARKVFRSSIEANQGRVIDMAGDSVLAVFETATGAVTTALAVQSELAALAVDLAEDLRLRFRIGVHLGDVIEKIDGTVYGDGVNIAARLEGLAGAGGVTVSDAVYGAVRGKVIASFEDQGEQQVKNITYPMRVYAVSELATPTPALPQGEWEKHPARPPTPARGSGSEASELPCATIARGGDGPGTPPAPFAGKPSIAVMAFDNMTSDPAQEYFCEGISEDILTDLSKIEGIGVIGRQSIAYKGKANDLRRVCQELGVRYVLEGSVAQRACSFA